MKTKKYDELIKNINMNCYALNLPDKVIEEAILLFKHYVQKKNLQGMSLEQYIGGLIWLACHKCNYPITPKSINNILQLDIQRSGSLIKGEFTIMRIGKLISQILHENIKPITLDKYIEMIQAKVNSPIKAVTQSIIIINYIEKNNLDIGHNYPALSSAICYISDRIYQHKINESEYSNIVGISTVSLRSYKRKLIKIIPNIKKHGTKYKWIEKF